MSSKHWSMVSLFEIANPKQWPTIPQSSFTKTGYPVYGANGKIGYYIEYNHEQPTILITCRGATCGTVNVCEPKSYVTGNSMALDNLDESKADINYLVYVLRYMSLAKAITGTAQPQITRESLKAILIPLPPLEEQRRIAAVLGRADALRAQRRAALALLDTLLQSTFLHLFGDPVTNPMGWEVKTLEEICETKGSYGSGASAIPYDETKPRYIRITDIKDDGSLNDDIVSPSTDESDWKKNWLEEGDIVFARSGATVGKTYLHRRENGECVYAGYLIKFRPKSTMMRPEFLFRYTQITSYASWIKSQQKVVAQPNINAQQYGQMRVIVPPLKLQDQFVHLVHQLDANQQRQRKYLRLLDTLFESLQQRAFAGQLPAPPPS